MKGNQMWESSRMMLPEHVEELRKRRKGERRSRPQLDEQWLQEMQRLLDEAMSWQQPVQILVFFPDGNRVVKGKVLRVDTQQRRLQLLGEDGIQSIPLADILQID